jgi:hypothetical protein
MPSILDMAAQLMGLGQPDPAPAPTPAPDGKRADSGVYDAMMGYGVPGKDKLVDVTPQSGLRWWNDSQRRLCIAPPADAMRLGYTVTTSDVSDETVAAHLKIARKAVKGRQYARGFRGAVIYIRVKGDQSKPLPESPNKIEALHVLMPSECRPSAFQRVADPDDVNWTEPKAWDLTPTRPGLQFKGEKNVHASRIIVVPGMDVPLDVFPPDDGFDAAVLDVYWEPARNLGLVTSSTVSVMTESSVAVYEMDTNATASGSDDSGWLAKLRALRRATSVLGAIRLPPGWKINRINAQLTGWREGKVSSYEDMSAVEGIPPAVFIGTPPAGLTSDDQASRRTYHRLLDGQERVILSDIILRVHEVQHGPNETRRVVWPSLEEPTAVERAQISQILMGRDAVGVQSQIIDIGEARDRHRGDRELEYIQVNQDDEGDPLNITDDDARTLEDLSGAGEESSPDDPQGGPLLVGQIQGASGIVDKVAAGALPREAGIAQLMELVGLDRPRAERVMGDVGRGFEPSALATGTREVTPPADPRADAKTYQPPASARNNARKVLRWREEHGDAVKGMTRTGWTRASQLASGDPVSRETVGRMAAFARHRKNSEVAAEFKDEPWRDAGYVAWLGWGGDSGINWAADIVDSEG